MRTLNRIGLTIKQEVFFVKKIFRYCLPFVFVLSSFSPVRAGLISGDITFGGTISSSIDLGTTNAINFLPAAFVTSTSGNLSILPPGSPASFSNFTFSPLPLNTPIWQAGPFAFDLDSVEIVSQGSLGLTLNGIGTMKAVGFDDTPYYWSFSADRTKPGVNTSIAFSSVNSAFEVVPEPNSGLLLGTGVFLLAASRINRSRKTSDH